MTLCQCDNFKIPSSHHTVTAHSRICGAGPAGLRRTSHHLTQREIIHCSGRCESSSIISNLQPPDFKSFWLYTQHLPRTGVNSLHTIVCVWHGIGFCWKSLRYSPIPVQGGSRKNPDLLGGWRDGSWIEAMKKKETFLNNPFEILNSIDRRTLRMVILRLVDLFDEHRADAVACSLLKMI